MSGGRDGFAQALRAEWTKFRSVRGWVVTVAGAGALLVLVVLLTAGTNVATCGRGDVEEPCPGPVLGPGGRAVEDRFYFVHQPLDGDGVITVRVTSMSGRIRRPDPVGLVPGVMPWAKAGLMIKESAEQGAPYAAVMVTGAHGVRMQHGFTEDVAGRPGGVSAAAPRWLRLARSGDTVTGYESADGRQWTTVGTARLEGLPRTVRIGLFAASPGDLTVGHGALAGNTEERFTEVTAVMDQVGVRGAGTGGAWKQDDIGVSYEPDGTPHHAGGLSRSGGTFTVTGVGEIGPRLEGMTAQNTLTGTTPALVVVIVIGALFVTSEYRRGLIRTTLTAMPRPGRVLLAKATVIGGVVFAAGLAGAAAAVPAGLRLLRDNGNVILPVGALTEARLIAGTAALLALSAVLALGLGALLRRGVAAVIAALALVVLPYALATASVLPDTASAWLLRLTPAAAFAVQQGLPEYPQVTHYYSAAGGFYPLPPWAGVAVLGGYAALAVGLAAYRMRRGDA
ncbi:DUF1349 domain-containing protein [Thermocatellispora tengchongensis]|uniref:hypothetical protein n=1 Tax=Thermocatellispora tengchongensis TaxID=1073253 RepID=UPI003628A883